MSFIVIFSVSIFYVPQQKAKTLTKVLIFVLTAQNREFFFLLESRCRKTCTLCLIYLI